MFYFIKQQKRLFLQMIMLNATELAPTAESKELNDVKNDPLKKLQEVFDSLKGKKKLEQGDIDTLEKAKELAKTQIQEEAALQKGNLIDKVKLRNDVSSLLKLTMEIDDTVRRQSYISSDVEKQLSQGKNNVVIKYLGLNNEEFKDINIKSFIDVVGNIKPSSSSEYSDIYNNWKDAGYEEDGLFFDGSESLQLEALKQKYNTDTVFKDRIIILKRELPKEGFDITKIIHTKILLENTNSDNVLNVLCDLDNDGVVHSSDNGLISGDEVHRIMNYMVKEGKEGELMKNISFVLGENVSKKEDLYKLLNEKPGLKYDFFDKLYLLGMSGVNIKNVLENGKEGVNESIKALNNNLVTSEKFAEALTGGFNEKYSVALKGLEEKVASETDSEKKEKLEKLLQFYKNEGNKTNILEDFRVNAAGLFISNISEKKGGGVGASITNTQIDSFLQKNTKDIIEGMQITLGFSMIGGSFVPGIGVNFSSKDFNISDNTTLKLNGGLFLTVPYIAATLNHTYNEEEIKKAGFKDFSVEAKNVGVTGNISTVANGLTLHWNTDLQKSVERKEKALHEFLNNIFKYDESISINSIKEKITSSGVSEEDKKYVDQFVTRVESTFNLMDFNILSPANKKLALKGIQSALVNQWKESVYALAGQKGYEFSGAAIGIQFVAGLFPILTGGVRWTKNEIAYGDDRHARGVQSLSQTDEQIQSGVGYSISEGKTIQQDIDMKESFEMFKNTELDTYLTANKVKVRKIPQNHPKDYKSFIQNLDTANLEGALKSLTSILSTDKNLRKDTYIKETIIPLLKNSKELTLTTRAYILSQFMDTIFEDQEGIEKVLNTDLSWNSREKGLKGVYVKSSDKALKENETNIYNSTVILRNDIREKVRANPTPTPFPNVIGYVASYKIRWVDEKAVSAGKGEASIPPGLAEVVGGEQGMRVINDTPHLVEHVMDKLSKSQFLSNMQVSLASLIGKNIGDSNFTFGDKKNFLEFLKNGKMTLSNGKEIKLQRDFVFFLYGKCANETYGLNIKSIDLGDGPIAITLNPSGAAGVNPNSAEVKSTDFAIGVATGGGDRDVGGPTQTSNNQDATTTPTGNVAPVGPNGNATNVPVGGPATGVPNVNTINNGAVIPSTPVAPGSTGRVG